MLRHIVIWTLPTDKSTEENQRNAMRIKSGLEGLALVAPGIHSIKVNISPLPLSTCNAHIVMDSLFEDESAFHAYLSHPEHVAFKSFIQDSTEKRLCMDYLE